MPRSTECIFTFGNIMTSVNSGKVIERTERIIVKLFKV